MKYELGMWDLCSDRNVGFMFRPQSSSSILFIKVAFRGIRIQKSLYYKQKKASIEGGIQPVTSISVLISFYPQRMKGKFRLVEI